MSDKDAKWLEDLDLRPSAAAGASQFLETCLASFPRCVRYSYREQQRLLPNILTVGAVLGAVPLDDEMGLDCDTTVFDARVELEQRNTPYLATRYVYETFVDHTTGLAMLNPGYDTSAAQVWDPAIVGDMEPSLVDFVFSEKLFVVFLVNGCIGPTPENALLNTIAVANPWSQPVGVYGYADGWNGFGGYLFEAQTTCVLSRNFGAIPTAGTSNLSFFSSRRDPIVDPREIRQNEPERIHYDPEKTYVAFVVGDGDNVAFVMGSRAEWMRQRAAACRDPSGACPPLTWTISPHLPRIAPDVLTWFYEMSHETANDYFMLPPSGHLYAYPASMTAQMQDAFVAATERDARLLGTKSTMDWEWFTTWWVAEQLFLPKYARRDGAIAGVFPLNVPYLFPTFTWGKNQHFKLVSGRDGTQVVLFRPRAWRGIDEDRDPLLRKFFLRPENMAKELAEYPRGSVSYVYMTSDGGLSLSNSFVEMLDHLPSHVHLVSSDTAARLAREASTSR